jgi:hypothetical protein
MPLVTRIAQESRTQPVLRVLSPLQLAEPALTILFVALADIVNLANKRQKSLWIPPARSFKEIYIDI